MKKLLLITLGLFAYINLLSAQFFYSSLGMNKDSVIKAMGDTPSMSQELSPGVFHFAYMLKNSENEVYAIETFLSINDTVCSLLVYSMDKVVDPVYFLMKHLDLKQDTNYDIGALYTVYTRDRKLTFRYCYSDGSVIVQGVLSEMSSLLMDIRGLMKDNNDN